MKGMKFKCLFFLYWHKKQLSLWTQQPGATTHLFREKVELFITKKKIVKGDTLIHLMYLHKSKLMDVFNGLSRPEKRNKMTSDLQTRTSAEFMQAIKFYTVVSSKWLSITESDNLRVQQVEQNEFYDAIGQYCDSVHQQRSVIHKCTRVFWRKARPVIHFPHPWQFGMLAKTKVWTCQER